MEYARLYETDSDDEDHEPLLQPKSTRLMEEGKSTSREEEVEMPQSSGRPAEHNTLGKLSHRVTIPMMSECIASIYQEDELVEKILMVHPTPRSS